MAAACDLLTERQATCAKAENYRSHFSYALGHHDLSATRNHLLLSSTGNRAISYLQKRLEVENRWLISQTETFWAADSRITS